MEARSNATIQQSDSSTKKAEPDRSHTWSIVGITGGFVAIVVFSMNQGPASYPAVAAFTTATILILGNLMLIFTQIRTWLEWLLG